MDLNLGYIAIEGVIGAGKTSLARMLSDEFCSHLVLEEFEKNPFLEEFYEDRLRYAFQTQIFFLLSRFKQQEVLKQQDLFRQKITSDYLFDKDRIFATLNLSEKEMVLYDGIARIMEREVLVPDLVIYLQASTDHLLENIQKRDRSYERSINRDYIHSLNLLYDEFFAHYNKTKLLILQTNKIDFVNSDKDFSYVMSRIEKML